MDKRLQRYIVLYIQLFSRCRVLAGALLKVKQLPACHVYQDMKLVLKTSGAAEPDALAAALTALRLGDAAPAAAASVACVGAACDLELRLPLALVRGFRCRLHKYTAFRLQQASWVVQPLMQVRQTCSCS